MVFLSLRHHHSEIKHSSYFVVQLSGATEKELSCTAFLLIALLPCFSTYVVSFPPPFFL